MTPRARKTTTKQSALRTGSAESATKAIRSQRAAAPHVGRFVERVTVVPAVDEKTATVEPASGRLARDLLQVLIRNGLTREDVAELTDELPSRDISEGFEHVVPITQARDKFKDIVDRAQDAPTLLTKHGRAVAAVVSASFYERAVEALENAEDAEAVAAARAEMAAGAEPIPAAEVHGRVNVR